jgi:hypothetical protein
MRREGWERCGAESTDECTALSEHLKSITAATTVAAVIAFYMSPTRIPTPR